MNIAEELGTIPADADPETYDAVLRDCINAWAAGLGLSGREAVARVSVLPGERRAIPACPAMRRDRAPGRMYRVDRNR